MGWKLAIGVLLLAVGSFAEETNQVRTLGKGSISGIEEPLRIVVTNQTQWTQLWERHNAHRLPKPPLPEVNFEKQSVIFTGLGRKSTGGYSIEVTDVRRAGNKTEIVVSTRDPKPGGLNIQALTAPFHIVEVPRITGEARFKTEENKKAVDR